MRNYEYLSIRVLKLGECDLFRGWNRFMHTKEALKFMEFDKCCPSASWSPNCISRTKLKFFMEYCSNLSHPSHTLNENPVEIGQFLSQAVLKRPRNLAVHCQISQRKNVSPWDDYRNLWMGPFYLNENTVFQQWECYYRFKVMIKNIPQKSTT